MSKLFPTIALAAAAAFLPVTAGAQNTQGELSRDGAPEEVHNVVLVHGAFVDGSGWQGVYENLTNRGYHVTVVQNPLTSLADDVASTRRALDAQDGPVILVGHSWGGTVITAAGDHPKVKGLVYVSALSPDAGETTAQQYDGYMTPPEFVIETRDDGYGFIPAQNFRAGFAADVSEAQANFLAASQVPINMSVFAERLEVAAWRSRPTWAVIATDDRAFDQRMLHDMADRMEAQVTEVAASHAVFMTQPGVVANVIDRAARQVAAATR